MAESAELEKKITELTDQPGHILGLDGWILRTIPEEKRNGFLKGYEKLLRIAFFPDHAKSQDQRANYERFNQAIANAVSFLTRIQDIKWITALMQ